MILPVVFGIIVLGRGFDRKELGTTYNYIYEPEDIAQKLEVTSKPSSESRFLVASSNSEVYKFLNFDTEFAIKSKSRSAAFSGYSDLVEANIDRENTVEILLSVRIGVENRTFPSDTKLTNYWQAKPQTQVGTHYIKSLLYGGLYLGVYRLTAAKPEYAKDIKEAAAKYFGKSGNISTILPENIEKFQDEVGGKASISVKMYNAPPFTFFAPGTLTKLVEEAKKFPEKIRNQVKGKLAAISMELADLHTIQGNFTEFKLNRDLEPVLQQVEAKYVDVKVAKDIYRKWSSNNYREELSADRESLKKFLDSLKKADKTMGLAVIRMDVTQSANQFDEAFEAYGESPENNKYRQWIKDIIKTAEERNSKNPHLLLSSFQNLLTALRSL